MTGKKKCKDKKNTDNLRRQYSVSMYEVDMEGTDDEFAALCRK